MNSNGYEPVIGLEVHAQLRTRSKAFCSCSTRAGLPPNSNTCPVCLGHPGTLPVLNREVVAMTAMLGLATHCSIRTVSGFARKNYFYPDLPKGYQITQFDDPICHNGFLEIEAVPGIRKRIGIIRIHMEEDAGKSIHDIGSETLVDLNRSGVPLAEIVSAPDLRSPAEAYAYLTLLRQTVMYLGICDGNLEDGSLRCDANISVRRAAEQSFGTRTELKNLNSFRNVQRALDYEIARHISILENGGTVVQETLQWDAGKGISVPMRSKEEAHDYRYFPEPDVPPAQLTEDEISELRLRLPELPLARRDRLVLQYALPIYDADVLTTEKALADYFETVAGEMRSQGADAWKMASNWIMGDVLRVLKEQRRSLPDAPLPALSLASLIDLVIDGAISGKIAKDVFEEMIASGETPAQVIERKGLTQVSDETALAALVDEALARHPDSVALYNSGRTNVLGFFVGQVMKATGGQANPELVNRLIKARLHGD